jgi:hypothetical protein
MRHCRGMTAPWKVMGLFTVVFCLCVARICAGAETVCAPLNAKAGRGEWLFVTAGFTNGEKALFVVDTGGPVTTLDKSMEKELGKRLGSLRVKFPLLDGKTDKVGRYAAPSIFVGDYKLKTGPYVICGDLKNRMKKAIPDRDVAGILGIDCLEQEVVRFDFAAGEICFLPSDAKPDAEWGTPHPLKLEKHKSWWLGWTTSTPKAVLDVAGNTNLLLVVDTGYLWDGILKGSVMERAMRTSIPQYRTGKIPPTKGYGVPFESIDVGGETYTNMVFGNGGWNLLGLGFLARNQMTIDFPRGVIYLGPLK